MASNYFNSAGTDFDDLFDPDVIGDGPTAATFKKPDGTLLKYAAAKYGTVGANTGFMLSSGADAATLWAKKGTASYALPINGNTYSQLELVSSGTGWAQIGFQIVGGNQYQVYGTVSGQSATVKASGAVPAGAATVQYTWGSFTIPSGDQDAGGTLFNGASTRQNLSGNPSANYTTGSFGSSSGTRSRVYPFTIDFFDASGNNISHTVINLQASVEGSA
ncbi:MAG: hypothetical protein ACTHMO_03655 [Rhodanobacteraceae bacterium]